MPAQTPAEHFLHGGDDGVEVEDLRLYHLPAGKGEQPPGQAGRPFAGPFDLPEVLLGRFAALRPVRVRRGREFLGDEGHVVEDHGEQVVEVMGDAASQLAEVLQTLGLLQLGLRLVLLGLEEYAASRQPIVVAGITDNQIPFSHSK